MKGQLLGQPFIMIFALLLGALIIVFGVRSFMDIKSGAEDVELSKFVTGLQGNADTYYNFDAGSSKKLSLIVPAKARQVCFFDSERQINSPIDDFLKAAMTDTKDNLFLLPLDSYFKTQFRIEHLKNGHNENPFCITKREGRINIIIETTAGLRDVSVEVKNG